MPEKKPKPAPYVSVAVRPDVRPALERLAELLSAEANRAGVAVSVSLVDAASIAIREAVERREKGGRKS